ncbi:SURF1 family protein [Notoacmeibacter ruber]|uniref:SURF1-like protein n=1 Tax=Notoacmeibacter ruber TaxID=2670375 RepID=A0A3L7J9N2_9HYPH|nr:SURF1 family protein [Notoacmeibacter ruber]RLQ87458.1 SURF1 family protein [Notoacmeibacter ruber]
MTPVSDRTPEDKRRGLGFFAAIMLVASAFVVLIALGTWQVKRLAWKEDLLATIDSRIHEAALPLSDIQGVLQVPGGVEFTPVKVSGNFIAGRAVFFLATFDGQSGWYVYQPFALLPGQWEGSDSDILLVNRGFVPYDQRDAYAMGADAPLGVTEIEGIAREMPSEKPSSLLPNNQPEDGLFFWKDGPTMAKALGINPGNVLPVFVDLGRPGADVPRGTWPHPGVTQVSLPNNHLSYALTWYGLAVVLVVVVGYAFWRSRHPLEDA